MCIDDSRICLACVIVRRSDKNAATDQAVFRILPLDPRAPSRFARKLFAGLRSVILRGPAPFVRTQMSLGDSAV